MSIPSAKLSTSNKSRGLFGRILQSLFAAPAEGGRNTSSSRIKRRIGVEALESRLALTTATLSVFVDGDAVELPNQIGIDALGDPVSQVRTIDADGTLDINPIDDEALEDITVGDFFDTWRTNAGVAGNNADAVFSSTQLLDNLADTTSTVQMFVNGEINREFEDYLIQEGDDIALIYGDNPVVSFNTTFGPMLFELFPDDAPGTVDNFLNYINDGAFEDTIFHRSVPGFVIQGGGFETTSTVFTSADQLTRTDTDPPIQNEFGILNTRGTISMAKLGGDPDSATNQFFVNLSDNVSLDTQNGGFTVFGQVLGFDAVDTIAGLPRRTDLASPFGELPVSNDGTLAVVSEVVGLGEISGVKFSDDNANGQLDTGEEVIAGATVFIDENANGEFDSDEPSTLTDADGRYLFQVETGAYSIGTVPTSSAFVTTSPPGRFHTVVVEIGREQANLDFGQADVAIEAIDDTLTVSNQGSAQTLDVLANDLVPEGTEITEVSQGSNGTVAIVGDRLEYTPAEGFVGSDTFTYTISDLDGLTNTATVVVNVQEGGTVTGLVFFDHDDDGEQGTDERGIPGVEVRLTGDSDDGVGIDVTAITANDGTYTFRGVPNGTYTITRTDANALATDAAAISETTVEVTDAGEVSATDNFTSSSLKAEYTSIAWFFASSSSPQEILRNVMAIAEDDAGNADLAQAIRDGSEGSSETPDGNGGDSSLVLVDDTYSVDEDAALTVEAAGGLLANDTVPDVVEISVATDVSDGVLVVDDDGSFSYVPNADFSGTDTFTYEVSADDETSTADVTITVNPIGDDPAAVNDSFSLNEDETLSTTAANGVLANDSNPDDVDLTTIVVTEPQAGTLTLNGDGSFDYEPNDNFAGTDGFTYELSNDDGFTDQAQVTLEVRPVNDPPVVNDASYTTVQDQALAVDAVLGLLAGATDVEDNPLDALLAQPPSNGSLQLNLNGSFEYQPNSSFTGVDTFQFVANDGSDDSEIATVTITVEEADQPSTIVLPTEFADPNTPATRNVGDTIAFDVEVQDPDDPVENVTFVMDLEESGIAAAAAQPTLNSSTGAFSWTPSASGVFEIRIIVINEDGEANTEVININVLS